MQLQLQLNGGSKLEQLFNFFQRKSIAATLSAYKLFLTESRNSRCAFSEFLNKETT